MLFGEMFARILHNVLMHSQKNEEMLSTCAVYAVKFNQTAW
jgi:hypothetical protein